MIRVLLVSAVLVTSSVLHATVLVPAEFSEIVTGSQIIVHGRVAGVRSAWTDARQGIETTVTLEAASYLKGGPGDTVTLRVPGGTVGRYRSLMVGAPDFREGEEVVLFLRTSGPAVARVFGLNQGVFRVRTDERTGVQLVQPSAPFVRRTPAARGQRAAAAQQQPMTLDAFRAQVRAALRAGGAR